MCTTDGAKCVTACVATCVSTCVAHVSRKGRDIVKYEISYIKLPNVSSRSDSGLMCYFGSFRNGSMQSISNPKSTNLNAGVTR